MRGAIGGGLVLIRNVFEKCQELRQRTVDGGILEFGVGCFLQKISLNSALQSFHIVAR
jgi:hypothetical protein